MNQFYEQLRRDAAKSLTSQKLCVPSISVDVGEGESMYEEFEKRQQKRGVLEQFFGQIRGIGTLRASDIVTHILSLPETERKRLAVLIGKGID